MLSKDKTFTISVHLLPMFFFRCHILFSQVIGNGFTLRLASTYHKCFDGRDDVIKDATWTYHAPMSLHENITAIRMDRKHIPMYKNYTRRNKKQNVIYYDRP